MKHTRWRRWIGLSLWTVSVLGCHAPSSPPQTVPQLESRDRFPVRGTELDDSPPVALRPVPPPAVSSTQAAWERPATENHAAAAGALTGSLDEPQPLPAAPQGAGADHETGAYLVRVNDSAELTQLLRAPALRGSRLTARVPWGEGWLVRLEAPEGRDTVAWSQEVGNEPDVQGLVREGRKYKLLEPDLPKQWAHASTTANTAQAWSVVPPASQASVVVAVLDTGLDVTHPEFSGRIVTPFNAIYGASPTTSVTDDDGHGTHVAGIIAADGQNGTGGAGVAWGVRILPIKVLTSEGGTDADILRGFMHAVNWRPSPDDGSRVRVINMSLGNSSAAVSTLYTEAVAIARAAGIVVVAASGNDAAGFVSAPANSPGMVAVGSSFRHAAWEGVSAFSNGGPRLDLVAPGEEIYAPLPDGRFGFLSGTSMASPYVAGVAALVTARYDPNNVRADATFVDLVRDRLRLAATDLGLPGRDNMAGSGRLDAGRAVAPATLEALP